MNEEEITLDTLDTVPKTDAFYKDPVFERERGASWVAKGLVYIFGGALLVCLTGGFVIIGIHPPPGAGLGKENIISEAVLPLLQAVGTFAATVYELAAG